MKALPGAAVSGPAGRRRLAEIPGIVPSPLIDPDECAFHARCPQAQDNCLAARPRPERYGTAHLAACFHPVHSGGLS
jgi:oligopeptide/dipeptide ABC transporter ATP-binding protein